MKATALACTLLAATLGFSSLASAQDWNGRRDRDQRVEQRVESRRDQRIEQRQEQRRDWRQEQRQDWRQDQRRDDRAQHWNRGGQPAYTYRQPGHSYSAPSYAYSAPNYAYSAPSYAYSAPQYYGNSHYYRGGTLPYQYRQQPYYVSNWNAHPGLYAPPYGHQWVQVGSDFMLVALATGLIANLLTQ